MLEKKVPKSSCSGELGRWESLEIKPPEDNEELCISKTITSAYMLLLLKYFKLYSNLNIYESQEKIYTYVLH